MKKNTYARPLMLMERFTPNEYVATCWYVSYGDCYTELYHDANGNGIYKNKESAEHIVTNHGSHRLPDSDDDYFKTTGADAVALPSQIESEYYSYSGTGTVGNNTSYSSNGFTRVNPYYFVYNGTTHYVKKISYAPSKGMS